MTRYRPVPGYAGIMAGEDGTIWETDGTAYREAPYGRNAGGHRTAGVCPAGQRCRRPVTVAELVLRAFVGPRPHYAAIERTHLFLGDADKLPFLRWGTPRKWIRVHRRRAGHRRKKYQPRRDPSDPPKPRLPKLDPASVAALRADFAAGRFATRTALAIAYGITKQYAGRLVKGFNSASHRRGHPPRPTGAARL